MDALCWEPCAWASTALMPGGRRLGEPGGGSDTSTAVLLVQRCYSCSTFGSMAHSGGRRSRRDVDSSVRSSSATKRTAIRARRRWKRPCSAHIGSSSPRATAVAAHATACGSALPPRSVVERPSGGPAVLLTTVDIGNGRSDKIEIRKGDDPAEVARAFCGKHGLPEAVLGPLTEHLLENLRKASRSLSVKEVRKKAHGAWGHA